MEQPVSIIKLPGHDGVQPRGLGEHEHERAISQKEIFLSSKKKSPTHTLKKIERKKKSWRMFYSNFYQLLG